MSNRELAYKGITELSDLSGSLDGAADYQVVYDATAGCALKMPPTAFGARCTTQTDYTSNTTVADVTGMTVNVPAAGTYAYRASLSVTANASGGVKTAISGTATATSITSTAWYYTGTTVNNVATVTALGGTSGATAACTNVIIEGCIVVNAAGTLKVQAAQNASFGTATSILVNSSFTLTRI